MAETTPQEIAKLIVTSAGLEPARRTRYALKKVVPTARIRSTGFKGIFALEAEEDLFELAERIYRECWTEIGHVTAILVEVESKLETIKDAAVSIGGEHIGSEDSFSFRLHKRGAHFLERDTLALEREIGGAIWTALEAKYGAKPRVQLKNPSIAVIAEVLGPVTALGISRRAWREQASQIGSD